MKELSGNELNTLLDKLMSEAGKAQRRAMKAQRRGAMFEAKKHELREQIFVEVHNLACSLSHDVGGSVETENGKSLKETIQEESRSQVVEE